jgi:F-type H+/Na+-transporting ATPase subunit alpha
MTTDFKLYLQKVGEFGVVEQLQQSLALVSGLPGARLHELVIFETGQLGEIFLVDRNHCEVLVLSKEQLKLGTRVTRTDEAVSVPVGKELLGKLVDPLGRLFTPDNSYKMPQEKRVIDSAPPLMASRATIKSPLISGVSVVDMMLPLGKGQRELVIGDKKTGKTAFALAAIKSQVKLGTVCIYAAVGKKKTDIKSVQEFMERESISERVIIIATTSYDSPSLIYQTPYAAMTVSEYFKDQGMDVLLIIDDLSTHSKFYREISLLAKRFPGRDAYPGDIFYTHGRLMERAGNYKHAKGQVSITCLPIVEIVEGDFTGYIATNLMGMTDGHLYFDSNVFYKGRRPALNIPLSVTRVGRQAQTHLQRNINTELTSFLSEYEKVQSLAQFGAELTPDARQKLMTGDTIYKIFEQPGNMVVPIEIQLIMFGLSWTNFIEPDADKVTSYRNNFMQHYANPAVRKFYEEIIKVEKLDAFAENVKKYKAQLFNLGNIVPPAPQVSVQSVAPPAQVSQVPVVSS